MKHRLIIGITGPSGAGKTTALKVLQALGAVIYDCDEIYHALLRTDSALLAGIEDAFPGTVQHGTLDRKALGARVFSDPAALRRLNEITHPAVKREILRRLAADMENGGQAMPASTGAEIAVCRDGGRPRLVAIDAIGLFEGGLAPLCDVTVAVVAPQAQRLARLMERDGITEDAARARVAAQKSEAEFAALCDLTLRNDGTQAEFETLCRETFQKIYDSSTIDI